MTTGQLYQAACAACHGTDGKGQPRSIVGFDTPLPDFTDCAFTTPEADLDWTSVIHRGGGIRALHRRMPAFGDALSEQEIERLVGHLRGFCAEPAWPRGELNFPRAFFTEKAFPENEAVFTFARQGGGELDLETAFLFEQRLGKRAQYEINVPLAFHQDVAGAWSRGIGDVDLAVKYALYDNLARGFIAGAGGEVDACRPAANRAALAAASRCSTPSGRWARRCRARRSCSFRPGSKCRRTPRSPARRCTGAPRSARRSPPAGGDARGRRCSKCSGPTPFGAPTDWDLVPQLQVSLSGLQHVLVNVGLRIPVKQPESRARTLMVYLLWDWFDGGLTSNWRRR